MIVGLGIDLCDVARIERAMERPNFLLRLYSEPERERIRTGGAQSAAGYFAAKEAVAKALGTGFRGFGMCDIRMANDAAGRPVCTLAGGAARQLERMGGGQVLVSITHSGGFAAAVAVIERG